MKEAQRKRLDVPYKSREQQREYYRLWYAKNGRSRATNYLESIKSWQEENPEKVQAHKHIRYRIRSGTLKRPEVCSECTQERKTIAHHDDYSKPLEVRWLCYSCHKILHNGG